MKSSMKTVGDRAFSRVSEQRLGEVLTPAALGGSSLDFGHSIEEDGYSCRGRVLVRSLGLSPRALGQPCFFFRVELSGMTEKQ